MQALTVKIDIEGTMHFIWSDELVALFEAGKGTIKRASHVEPTTRGIWGADMSPSGGPMLGPFKTRGEALSSEVAWLEDNILRGQNDTNRGV